MCVLDENVFASTQKLNYSIWNVPWSHFKEINISHFLNSDFAFLWNEMLESSSKLFYVDKALCINFCWKVISLSDNNISGFFGMCVNVMNKINLNNNYHEMCNFQEKSISYINVSLGVRCFSCYGNGNSTEGRWMNAKLFVEAVFKLQLIQQITYFHMNSH